MLEKDELADVAAAFGVADEQVRRDHLAVVFFGGTALGRTHLTDPEVGARLSEDIDLYSPERRDTAAAIDQGLPLLLRREFPRGGWNPPLSSVRSADAAQFVSADGIRVRVQVLDSGGEHQDLARWPVELVDVRLRYRDVPATVTMRSPILPAFAAMKTLAWADRHAARDRYDLAGLARIGALTREAAALVRKAVGWSVTPSLFANVLVPDWEIQLENQTRVLPSAALCLAEVRRTYADALNWLEPDDP